MKLIIYQLEIVFMSWLEVRKDGGGKVFLTAKLYPPPTAQDIFWNVTTKTSLEVILRPGEKESNYSAEIIGKEADHTYTFTLNIDNLTDDNLPANVSLSIKSLSKTQVATFDMSQEVSQNNINHRTL